MLFNQVRKTIDRYHLLERGDRLIVGVSGGMDSMVLLRLLNAYCQEFDLSLIVAHINHGLRPVESEKEAEFVQKETERLGSIFEYGQFDVKEFQKAGGLSLQDAGRRIRFHFFNSLLSKYGAQKIALGHHADDQVETVLLRLMRGSGLRGLKGMLPIREGRVIRPLLEVWREEIESFAKERGIPYCFDSSNLKRDYLRNRLRLELIPMIEKEYQPNFRRVVMRASAIFREENDYLERGAEEACRKMVREGKDALSFRLSDYRSLHQAIQWRVLQRMLIRIYGREMSCEEEEWPDVSQIYKTLHQPVPSCFLELPHGVCLEKRYDIVSLVKGKARLIPPFEIELAAPGRTHIEEIGKEVVIEEISRDDRLVGLAGSTGFNEARHTALLDRRNLQFPLKMRNFRPGDRFQPLGVKGTQKLKEFFIDHKVPRFERPNIPLLVAGEVIAWVVGYRIDERVKVTEETERVLRVEVL
jgi:tRNA(Ile)-lysidine synthase